MRYRAALIGSMFASFLVATPQMAVAQQTGGFEQIPQDQSPIVFASDGHTAYHFVMEIAQIPVPRLISLKAIRLSRTGKLGRGCWDTGSISDSLTT